MIPGNRSMVCGLTMNKNKSRVVKNNIEDVEKYLSIRSRSLSNYASDKNRLILSSPRKLDGGLNKMSI